MILISFFSCAGPSGSSLPGPARVALVLHYFLGWRNPLPSFGGTPIQLSNRNCFQMYGTHLFDRGLSHERWQCRECRYIVEFLAKPNVKYGVEPSIFHQIPSPRTLCRVFCFNRAEQSGGGNFGYFGTPWSFQQYQI